MRYLAALLLIFPLFGADPVLLSTTAVAQQVSGLQAQLKDANDRERNLYFDQLQAKLSAFIVEQLEAEPNIDRWQLREQLTRARGLAPPERSHYHDSQPPYVFRASGGSGPVVWAVVYGDALYYGMGGRRIVVESYVVANGKARLAGRGGAEMTGYDLNADEMRSPSTGAVSVLIHGILEWSGGHQFPGKAILYEVGPGGVKTDWESPMLPGLTAHPGGAGFTVTYHDEERHVQTGARDASVTDTYSFGAEGVAKTSTRQE